MAKAYVIVGASLAGATAAITLRELGADGTVTLIGAEHEPPYERPPLSKAVLRGEAEPDSAQLHPQSFYPEHGIEIVVDREEGRLVRRGAAWLNPTWEPRIQVHEVCPACGAKVEVG